MEREAGREKLNPKGIIWTFMFGSYKCVGLASKWGRAPYEMPCILYQNRLYSLEESNHIFYCLRQYYVMSSPWHELGSISWSHVQFREIHMEIPPSMTNSVPVTYADCGERENEKINIEAGPEADRTKW